MKRLFYILLLVLALLTQGSSREEPIETLKVGMMPAVDSVPFYFAEENGLFEKYDLDVELVLFTNGQTRQTALQTGQVDGAMTDLVALITNTAGDLRIKGTLSTDGVFPLLSAVSIDDTENLRAGLMEISVTNYVLDAYLAEDHMLEKIYINEIPARLEALLAGNLDIGIFPEPFASIGARRGLEKLIFPGIPRQSMNIIAFTEEALEDKEDAVRRFHQAYGEAVDALAEDPQKAVDTLLRSIPNLPEDIGDEIHMPLYHSPSLPDSEFIAEIIRWTESVTGRDYDISPEDVADRSFVESLGR